MSARSRGLESYWEQHAFSIAFSPSLPFSRNLLAKCTVLPLHSILYTRRCVFFPPEYLMLDRGISTGNNENSFQNGLVVFHPPWLFPYSFRTLLLWFLMFFKPVIGAFLVGMLSETSEISEGSGRRVLSLLAFIEWLSHELPFGRMAEGTMLLFSEFVEGQPLEEA